MVTLSWLKISENTGKWIFTCGFLKVHVFDSGHGWSFDFLLSEAIALAADGRIINTRTSPLVSTGSFSPL
jgi:hypothetical protein